MTHPNASVAAVTTALGVLVVYVAGRFKVNLTTEDGALIAGALGAVVLFVGRRGIRGTAGALWRGSSSRAPSSGPPS